MGIVVPDIETGSKKNGSGAASGFRIIPRIEAHAGIVTFVQRPLGKALLLAAFALLLRFFVPDLGVERSVMLPIALITFFPEYRRFILAVVPIVLVFHVAADSLALGASLSVLTTAMILYAAVMKWPDSGFARRPVATLLFGFTALTVVACVAPLHSLYYRVLWTLVGTWASYLWFVCYALTDRSSMPKRDLTLELATLRPLWNSTFTPFPKGAAYLRRIEAQTPQELAVTQLKGLKLLVWAMMLAIFEQWWFRLFHGYLRIPSTVEALTMSMHGTPAPLLVRWESQALFFFELTLNFAVIGHQIIALCRMAGFNALRNSCRPLSSTTISEFFNRFYFYFKELLVDLFFYPTFLRYFKRHRRLRTFFATFVAIVFGSSFFHLARDWQFIQRDGLWKSLIGYQVLFFQNVILATAVGLSQLRKRGPKASSIFRRRVLQPAGVLFFYCVLGVFGDESRLYTLGVHLKYLASLFFIRL